MKKPLFKKVCIVGVGLIGGSLGMAIKKRRLARWVVGVVHRKITVAKAFQKKALDIATLNLKEGVRGADLVILCAPVSVIKSQLKALSRLLDKKTIVIDVGSSKKDIHQTAKKYLKKNVFVGCHPMAGSEKTGVQFADADLFKESVCFLTSSNKVVKKLWQKLGADIILMDSKSHDMWAAQASHLPHIIAFALFQGFSRRRQVVANPSIQNFARLSKSDPELWADILLSNRKYILASLDFFMRHLFGWKQSLKTGRRARLVRFIEQANRHSFEAFSKSGA